MLTTIFRVILTIVHHAYATFERVESHLKFLRRFASKIYRRFRLGARIATEHDEECQFRLDTLALKRNIERINKLPVHLCIVVAAHKESVSFFHLARILGWSVAAAIPYVSFYDHDGFLKRNRQALRMEFERANSEVAAFVDWEPKTLAVKSGENGRNGNGSSVLLAKSPDVGRGQEHRHVLCLLSLALLRTTSVSYQFFDSSGRVQRWTLRHHRGPSREVGRVRGRRYSTLPSFAEYAVESLCPRARRSSFKRTTRVQVFSNSDGKSEIVSLVRSLSVAVSHGLLKMEEIDSELLNDKLRLENTPDPDLALVCAPALSTYGLLPWHTRTTEFYNLRSHRDVTINDFIRLLQKYGPCQQRYGK